MWDAWDQRSQKAHRPRAESAGISDSCADDYVLLAEEAASSLHEAMELYEKGVRAGECALGEKTFSEDAGHFWGLLETRPYMRARAGLASCLQEAGKLDDAIGHYQALLRLNPNDNQGNRHMLAACFVAAGRNAEAAGLLESHPEEIMAGWSYTTALVAVRISGASSGCSRETPPRDQTQSSCARVSTRPEAQAAQYAAALRYWQRRRGRDLRGSAG